MTKILIIDTSIMCVWLKVPGKETTGKNNEYTYDIVARHIEEERGRGTKLVLPIATIIETGNHIAHANGNKEHSIEELSSMIISSAKGENPWIAIDMQHSLWDVDNLSALMEEWKKTVISEKQSIGDAAIVQIAKQFAPTCEVEIFTGDGGLKNYEYKIQGQAKKELRRNRNKSK
ncbi:MAG: hypothetical protein IKO75_10330 [Bacteroidales bacterium]|nr:hypothetical protein [Bacteroidales bacterium]